MGTKKMCFGYLFYLKVVLSSSKMGERQMKGEKKDRSFYKRKKKRKKKEKKKYILLCD